MDGKTTVAIGIWDGVEELDVVGPYEVLAAWASMSSREIEVLTVAESSDRSAFTSSSPLQITRSRGPSFSRLSCLMLMLYRNFKPPFFLA